MHDQNLEEFKKQLSSSFSETPTAKLGEWQRIKARIKRREQNLWQRQWFAASICALSFSIMLVSLISFRQLIDRPQTKIWRWHTEMTPQTIWYRSLK